MPSSGLPKDITLDGELWMARGAFDQTSQICRTTVRLGRLHTFTHFLERDSMERQWLREQVGGRLASQDRVRGERSAVSLLRLTARRLDNVAVTNALPASAITSSSSAWKTWKRALPGAASGQVKRKGRPLCEALGRSGVAGAFLRALFGRSSAVGSRSLPAPRSCSSRPALLRCPKCGKIVKRTQTLAERPANEVRANADQLLSGLALPSAPATSLRAFNAVSSRRPHVYSTLNTSISGLSARPIPSAYTHVCRRKTKSSNEWNRIKFMVSLLVHEGCNSLVRGH